MHVSERAGGATDGMRKRGVKSGSFAHKRPQPVVPGACSAMREAATRPIVRGAWRARASPRCKRRCGRPDAAKQPASQQASKQAGAGASAEKDIHAHGRSQFAAAVRHVRIAELMGCRDGWKPPPESGHQPGHQQRPAAKNHRDARRPLRHRAGRAGASGETTRCLRARHRAALRTLSVAPSVVESERAAPAASRRESHWRPGERCFGQKVHGVTVSQNLYVCNRPGVCTVARRRAWAIARVPVAAHVHRGQF